MPDFWPRLRNARWARGIAALATITLVLLRFLPAGQPPLIDQLDIGWAWGVSVAAAKHWGFGQDLIFTYGPYAAVATLPYEPALRGMALAGGAVLGMSFAAGLLGFAGPWRALLMALLLPLALPFDALALVQPLPALLLALRTEPKSGLPRASWLVILACLPALALLPLIKGSYLGSSLLYLAALCLAVWRSTGLAPAIALPALTLPLSLGTWLAAGQAASGLAVYFRIMAEVISGQNAAMVIAQPGAFWRHAVMAILASLCLWLLLALRLRGTALFRLAAAGLFAGLVLVILKAGFLRQDTYHEITTAGAIGLAFALAALDRPARQAAAGIGLCALTLGVGLHSVPFALPTAPELLASPLRQVQLLANLLADPGAERRAHDAAVAGIRGLPWPVQGSADIYSAGQVRLLASNVDWHPRPVFQSYLAFTPLLAGLNRDHLASPRAAQNIFLRIEPIDGRFPPLEDGASWPGLLSYYAPAGYDAPSGIAWLRRLGDAAAAAKSATPGETLLDVTLPRGTKVNLPASDDAIWAEVDFRPTRLGRLFGSIWRLKLPGIIVTDAAGRQSQSVYVPGMGQDGFIISPVIRSTADFLHLYDAAPHQALAGRRPVSFAIDIDPDYAFAWKANYHVRLRRLALPSHPAQFAIDGGARPQPVEMPPPSPQARCVLDTLDGAPPGQTPLPAALAVSLDGWALFDGQDVQVNDLIQLVLRAGDGNTYAAQATAHPRRDVVAAFRLGPEAKPGFTQAIDAAALPPGIYSLGVAISRGKETRLCSLPGQIRVAGPH